MNISLTPDFSEDDLQKIHDDFLQQATRRLIDELEVLGHEFIIQAKNKTPEQNGFNDQTGDLRRSIGFAILQDGQIIRDSFGESLRGSWQRSGTVDGMNFIQEIAKEHPTGLVLVTVAGMEYASWVENMGRDVISGSTLGAQKKLERIFKRLEKWQD